jgi:ABC-type polysaccharide/polyol phosphate export permease
MLNPMAQAIQDSRYAVISHDTKTIYQIFDGGWHALIPFMFVIVVFIIGLQYFRKQSKYFAENI